MQWKVLIQVPLQEVQNRLKELEKIYGSLSILHSEYNKGRMPADKLNDYIQWTGMSHAISAYQEGEDFEYLAERELNLSPEEYRKITPKRLEMLDHLIETPANSINELAQNLERDVKNVYNDLMLLATLGFVSLHREGRNIKPKSLVQEITLLLG